MLKPRVFITNQAGHDFSKAALFGQLVPITTGNINVFRPDRDLYRIQQTLQDFDPAVDYLLLSGHTFVTAMAVSIIALKWVGGCNVKLNFLVYNAKQQKYLKHIFTWDTAQAYFKRDEEND